MNTIQANIDNLTSLWRTIGERAHAYTSRKDFDHSVISYSQWPNRLWFHHDLNEINIKAAKEVLQATSTRLVLPYWDIYGGQSYKLLEENGFEKQSEQIGMSLRLNQEYQKIGSLRTEKVSNESTALLWEKLFMQAFNYKISHKLILSSYDEIDYLIAYHENKTVGTGIVYSSENAVVGIHAMGIVPEMRRKGFAEKMMINILSQSARQGFKYATLQASSMGKGLYLKLGFEEEFILTNYALQQ